MIGDKQLVEHGFSLCGQYVAHCLNLGRSWAELTGRLVMAAHRTADLYRSLLDKYEAVDMPGGWALFAVKHCDLVLNGIEDTDVPGAIVAMVCVREQTVVRELRGGGGN